MTPSLVSTSWLSARLEAPDIRVADASWYLPQAGRNAILELSHKIIALQALNRSFPGMTLNVGRIEGGGPTNVVPHYARADIDVRVQLASTYDELFREIQAIANSSTVPDTSAELHGELAHPPFEKSSGSAWLLGLARDLAQRDGYELRDVSSGGGSDGNITASLGIPTLDGLGPVGGAYHSPDEYIELDSVLPRLRLLCGLILRAAALDRHLS